MRYSRRKMNIQSYIRGMAAVCLALVCLGVAHATDWGPMSIPPDLNPSNGDTYDGGTWGTGTMTLDSGTVTLNAGFTTTNTGAGRFNGMTGTLRNEGTFLHKSTSEFTVGGLARSPTFQNVGVIEFQTNGSAFWFDAQSGDASTLTGSGKLYKSAGGATIITSATKNRRFNLTGEIEVSDGLTLQIDHPSQTYGIGNFSALKVGDGSTLLFSGYWSSLTGVVQQTGVAGSGLVRTSGKVVLSHRGLIDIRGNGGLHWGDGADFKVGSYGSPIATNLGEITIEGTAARTLAAEVDDTAALVNRGTIVHGITADVNLTLGSSSRTITLRTGNGGVFEFAADGDVYLLKDNSGRGHFEVLDGGKLLKTGTGTVSSLRSPAESNRLKILGEVDVQAGTLEIDSAGRGANGVETWWEPVGNALKAGTWIVQSNGILDIKQVGSDTSTNIRKIDTNAAVRIAGGTFVQMGAGEMRTLNGTLGVHERSQVTLNNGLVCTNSTKFEFGIRDRTENPTNACIRISGDTHLNGTVDAIDNGDMRPGKYTIITNVTGNLTNHGLTVGELPPRILGKLLIHEGEKGYVILRLNQPGTILTVF